MIARSSLIILYFDTSPSTPCSSDCPCRLIFFPKSMISAVEKVMMPSPPICINMSIIVCPKDEKSAPVLRTIKPVTQVAEVAVNPALISPMLSPFDEARGKLKKVVPSRIIIPKLSKIIFEGWFLKRENRFTAGFVDASISIRITI